MVHEPLSRTSRRSDHELSYCLSLKPKQRSEKTTRGYRTYRYRQCRRAFHEWTGTPFHDLGYPPTIVLLVVFSRLRSHLSLRDLAEIFLERGVAFTHETVRDWEARFAPLITDQVQMKRRGQGGASWQVDETYGKVQGKWCYLYRAIDQDGNLVDSLLSQKRAMDAAQRFSSKPCRPLVTRHREEPFVPTCDPRNPWQGRSPSREA